MSWPTSDAWQPALRAGPTYRYECDVLANGVVTIPSLPVVSGDVRVDGSSVAHRSCSLTIATAIGITPPSAASDALAPYGNEIQIRAGFVYPNGTYELIPVGRFRIDQAEVIDTAEALTIAITGVDRAAVVEEERFDAPWVLAPSTNIGTELLRIVQRTYPTVTSTISGTEGKTTPAEPVVLPEQKAPWSNGVTRTARDFGLEAFFDGEGRFVVRAISDPSSDHEFDYVEGAGCTVTSARNKLDAASYNKAIVETAPTDGTAPLRGVATDNDPSSPTYYGGAFGKRPRWLKSPILTTQAHVDAAAITLLATELGGTEILSFNAVTDFSRDVGDVVRFVRARMGVSDKVIISTLTLPLDPSRDMSVTTRKRRL